MATTPVLPKLVGQRIKRREDPRLIQGRGTYVDDIALVGHAASGVQAQRRRARAHSLHRHQRREGDGRRRSRLHRRARSPSSWRRCRSGRRSRRRIIARWPWTRSATAASRSRSSSRADRYVARDAADAIVVSYDTLPAVVDLELAMTGKPTVIHPRSRTTWRWRSCPSGTGVSATGEVDDSAIDEAFAKAEVVISQRMVNQRLAPSAMEPRGVVAHFEPGKETMTIWSSTQNPHILRVVHRRDDRPRPGSGPRHRARSRRRLRRQDQHLRRRVRRRGDLEASRHPGEVDRGSLGGVRRHDARPRHPRLHRSRRQARRHRARPEAAADRRHRRLQHAAHRGDPDAHDADGERAPTTSRRFARR